MSIIKNDKVQFELSPIVPNATADNEAVNKGQVKYTSSILANPDTPYTDLAALYADQANQKQGYLYKVTGQGLFYYRGTTNASAGDYEPFGSSTIPKEHEINGVRSTASIPLAGNKLASPVNAAFTAGTGTLAAGTYYYRVSAINQYGETIPSTETSFTAAANTGINVNWGSVTGATGYKIYGRSTGAELLMASVGAVTTWLDDGSITPAGAMPTQNTTSFHPIDWNAASLFDLTLTAPCALIDQNLPTGVNVKVADIRLTGDFAFTFPAYYDPIPGDTYDGTISNTIKLSVINGTSGSEKVEYQIINNPA